MTLRDYFAAAALDLAHQMWLDAKRLDDKTFPELAYSIADAMLAERAKGDR